MSNAHILTTSGFILPDNQHYEVLTKEKIGEASGFRRTALATNNSAVSELVKNNQIYHSPAANEAFLNFEDSSSFDHFMRLVDVASTILKDIDYNKFFELQGNNRHLSPFSFKMCVELLSGEFLKTYHTYSVIPSNIRFCADNGYSASQFASNVKTLHRSKSYYANTWEQLLSALANDRAAFSTFFKYVFVDSY